MKTKILVTALLLIFTFAEVSVKTLDGTWSWGYEHSRSNEIGYIFDSNKWEYRTHNFDAIEFHSPLIGFGGKYHIYQDTSIVFDVEYVVMEHFVKVEIDENDNYNWSVFLDTNGTKYMRIKQPYCLKYSFKEMEDSAWFDGTQYIFNRFHEPVKLPDVDKDWPIYDGLKSGK